MDPEEDEKKQDDKDISELKSFTNNNLLKKAKSTFEMLVTRIAAIIVAIPIIIHIIIIGLIIFAVLSISWLFNYVSNNVIGDVASDRILKNEVEIALASEEEGYYFKLSKEALEKYKYELNMAYLQGYYHMEIDEDKIKDRNEAEGKYDENDKPIKDPDVYDWFNTEKFEHYFVKMLRAEIASSYPKIGEYQGENGTEDKAGNKKDKEDNYAMQGIVRIRRTFMNKDGTLEEKDDDLEYLPYENLASENNEESEDGENNADDENDEDSENG